MTNNLQKSADCDMFLKNVPLPGVGKKCTDDILPVFESLSEHERKLMRSGKVLIMEANRRLRFSRTHALSQEGYYVTSVSNVKEAVKAAKRQSYELLVISVEEPELLNMLLAQFPPETSVLIIANEDMVSKTVECSGTGIHSFLIQPFGVDKFKDSVAQTIDRTRLVKDGLQSKILTDLEHANHLLASEAELDKFFKLVVEISGAGAGADYVSLSVKDKATGRFVVKAEVGDCKPTWKKVYQQTIKIGQAIIVDATTPHRLPLHRLMTETGISAVLFIPLVIKEDVIGAINHIKVTKRARFTSSDLNFASILGWWSSMALENDRLFSSVQMQRFHLERLKHGIFVAQENERSRMALDIHDGVVQWLVGASYNIKACSSLISESKFADLEFELTKARKTLQRGIKEVRRVIMNLRPLPLEEVSLIEALHQAAEVLNEDGIRYHVEVEGKLSNLTPTETNTIYWIVQEALTNIRNHSKASDVSLKIQCHDNTVSVEVRDNGQGFDLNQVMNSTTPLGHIGLLGMKERAELVGGYLCMNSNPGKGTSISFTFAVSS